MVPKRAPGEVIESDAHQKEHSRCFGGMTQLPGVRGVLACFVNVCGAQTFSGDCQLHLRGTANGKERRKFAVTPSAWSGLVRFAARWTDYLHKAFRDLKTHFYFEDRRPR